jgi:hypothetical protein
MAAMTVEEITALGYTYGKAKASTKVVHPKRKNADSAVSVCNKKLGADVLPSDANETNICVACRVVIQKGEERGQELTEVDATGIVSNLMEAASKAVTKTEGDTVAKATDTKAEDKHAETVEQISANIERFVSLLEAENEEGATELADETEAMISGLPTRGNIPGEVKKTWAQFKQDSRTAIREAKKGATEKPKASTEVVTLETTEDYRSVEGMEDLINEGANVISEGVKLHLKASETAYNLGRNLLNVRLSIKVKGAPDLKAKSQAYRDASGHLKAQAIMQLREAGVDEFDANEAAEKLWKSMQNQTGDVLADYAKELEGPRRTDWDGLFGEVAKAHPALSPSEAVSAYYGIDLIGPREKARIKAREKSELAAKAKQALEAGNTDEAEELEDEIKSLDGKAEPTPGEKAKADVKKIKSGTKALAGVNPEELEDEDRKAVRDDIQAQIDALRDLVTKYL